MSTDALNSAVATGRIAAIPVPLPGPGISIPFAPEPGSFMHFEAARKTVFDGDDWSFMDTSVDIDGAAARVVAAYDRNDDGSIDVKNIVNETNRFDDGSVKSIGKLAAYADRNGNNDGTATTAEIADAIRKFDQGSEGDGRLSGQERETFLEVFGETANALRFRHLPPRPHSQLDLSGSLIPRFRRFEQPDETTPQSERSGPPAKHEL